MAIDARTKMLPVLQLGPRTQHMAHLVIHSLRQSLAPGCIPVLATWDIRSEKSRTGKQAERRYLLFVREKKIRQGRQKRATLLKWPLPHSVKSSSLPFVNPPSTVYAVLW
jgi:hypothetical protein